MSVSYLMRRLYPAILSPLLLQQGALAWADGDALRQQVACAETAFRRAAEGRDREGFLSFVDPDARFVGRSVARGREEVATAWASLLAPDGPAIRWRPAVIEVSADGHLALSRGPYRVTIQREDGTTQESWGHFNSTWRRDAEGRWLVLFDSGGDDGMTPTEAELEILEADPDCP